MQSYEKNLNEILKTDKVVKETEETLVTMRGHIQTVWERISAYKFRKLEVNRLTPA